MNTLCSHVLEIFSVNTCDSDGLLVMTTATDHKTSLDRSAIKKTFSKTLRVETIANSAAVAMGRSKSLTIIVSPLDMIDMIGMAQALATLAYWEGPYLRL
jgi:hypothetical protein